MLLLEKRTKSFHIVFILVALTVLLVCYLDNKRKSETNLININDPTQQIQITNVNDFDIHESQSRRNLRNLLDIKGISLNDPKAPKVAWLMSFPNSGTTYTMLFVQQVSETTTANVNGGNVYLKNGSFLRNEVSSIAAYNDQGPFLFSDYPLPSTYLMTKTHCTGYCYDCSPRQYAKRMVSFLQGCQSGIKVTVDKNTGQIENQSVKHDISLVKKAIHLMRNPLDNIGARFHYYWKTEQTKLTFDTNGFNNWCRYLDEKYAEQYAVMYPKETWELAQRVPCHAEFYKYVQWHNLSFLVTGKETLDVEALLVKYEDFEFNMDDTLAKITDFLELPIKNKPPKFEYHRHKFFSEDYIKNVYVFMRSLASFETWSHIKPYCEQESDKFDLCAFLNSLD